MPLSDWIFRLRWLEWGLAPALALAFLIRSRRGVRPRSGPLRFGFGTSLVTMASLFLILGTVAKLTQLQSLAFSGQDFWLFEDMLRQMLQGKPFLTRFAPQEIGWVQHGVVHPFLSWYTALPLAWLLGPTGAALVYGPLCLATAGVVLGVISRRRFGDRGALMLAAAFLLSSQVGTVLMYEVHPEVAYPVFFFLWIWAIGLSGSRVRPLVSILALVFGLFVKEDSFLLFLPISVWLSCKRSIPIHTRKLAWLSLPLIVGVMAIQMISVRNWSSGQWGPAEFQGETVTRPIGAGLLKGIRWESLSSVQEVTQTLLHEPGREPVLQRFATFLTSRKFVGLILLLPWVLIDARFWFCVLPLMGASALLGGMPASLMLYYSAPFIALLWGLGATARRIPAWSARWALVAALLLGSGGLEFVQPSHQAKQIRTEAAHYSRCLKSPQKGIVSSRILGSVPRELVYTDRIPVPASPHWDRIQFALIGKDLGSYESPSAANAQLLQELSRRPDWVQLGLDCKPGSSEKSGALTLFVKAGSP